MRSSVELLSDELTHKYSLPEPIVLDAVETAITCTLTKAYRSPVICRIQEGQLHVTAVMGLYDPLTIEVGSISKKLRRAISYNVELELQKRQAINEYHSMRELQGQVITGTISRIANNHVLFVMLEIDDLVNRVILLGECPLTYQPPHERSLYRIGDTKSFLVTSVRPIAGRTFARVRIVLNRTSRDLPARLLYQLTGVAGIKCQRRIAGGYSEIVTPQRIPKSAINTVGKELKEHVQVFIKK